MMKWSAVHTTLIGATLIVLINAIVLIGVAYNRSGKPESVLRVSARELSEEYGFLGRADELGGIDVRLHWRVLDRKGSRSSYWSTPEWLDEAKLASLGFNLRGPMKTAPESDYDARPVSREVLLVLEMDGPAYQEALKRAERRAIDEKTKQDRARTPERYRYALTPEEELARERNLYSRLFVIDAGLDLTALRASYADRDRYTIVHGLITAGYTSDGKGGSDLNGHVSVHNDRITVPREFAKVLATIRRRSSPDDKTAGPAPLTATIAFGRRLEPWITNASKGGTKEVQ